MLPRSASRAGMAASQGSLEPSRDSASSAVRRNSGSELVVEFASCRPGPSDPKFDGDLHPSHPSKKVTRVLETATLVFLGGERGKVWYPWVWYPVLVGQRRSGWPKHALSANKGKTFCRLKPKVGDGLTRPKNKTKQDGNMFCIMITNKMHLRVGECLSVH